MNYYIGSYSINGINGLIGTIVPILAILNYYRSKLTLYLQKLKMVILPTISKINTLKHLNFSKGL